MIICKAGHRVTLTCQYKRNLDKDTVYCAIDATPVQCTFAQPALEHIQEKAVKMGVKLEEKPI